MHSKNDLINFCNKKIGDVIEKKKCTLLGVKPKRCEISYCYNIQQFNVTERFPEGIFAKKRIFQSTTSIVC